MKLQKVIAAASQAKPDKPDDKTAAPPAKGEPLPASAEPTAPVPAEAAKSEGQPVATPSSEPELAKPAVEPAAPVPAKAATPVVESAVPANAINSAEQATPAAETVTPVEMTVEPVKAEESAKPEVKPADLPIKRSEPVAQSP